MVDDLGNVYFILKKFDIFCDSHFDAQSGDLNNILFNTLKAFVKLSIQLSIIYNYLAI